MFFLVVLDRGLDRVLGQDRAMDLDRRQRQLLGDLSVTSELDAMAEPQP
jgi:hypothetical protein